jgi:hypothetical protein
MLTFAQAHEQWRSEIMPAVVTQYGANDHGALSECWNDYTDDLCKDGQLGDLQYHHCPAWDEEMPVSDQAFILEAMGVISANLRIPQRPDGNDGWDERASHWRVLILRNGMDVTTHYSMGSAHTSEPELADVMGSLLRDAEGTENTTFEEWADSYGLDSDSRKAERSFTACQQIALELKTLFTARELDDLRELFEDF